MDINLGKYNKFIAALLGAAGVVGAVISDGKVTSEEAFAVFSAITGALAVYQVRNKKA